MDYSSEYLALRSALNELETRIARIEVSLQFTPDTPVQDALESAPQEETAVAEALELRIGQYWFAKLGIVTLIIGVGFLLTFPYPSLPSILPSMLGYLIAGSILLLAQRLRNSFQHISGYLLGGGIVLLFFAALRLSFFGPAPVLEDRLVSALLLAVSVGIGLQLSSSWKSAYLVGVSLTLGYVAALVADNSIILFLMVSTLCFLAVAYAVKYAWPGLLVHAITLSIVSHLLWFLNTPILGRSIQLASSPHINIVFVLAYMSIIAWGTLWRKEQEKERAIVVLTSVVNGLGGYLLFLFLTMAKFNEYFVSSHTIASFILLGIAVLFWIRERSMFSTFTYVMLGYMALSVAIVAQFKSPDHFIWLSWQSIIVVSMAVWFRSRFIVVANFFIYLMLFGAYLLLAGKVGAISLSFGAVALLTARILNTQKHRLELKTELMRNAYLASAFIVFPYALYHTVPPELRSMSWLAVALFYYIMARVIHRSKYRWMALLTLMLTIVHVLAVDITNLDPVYRIILFIVLGIGLLGISLIYSRRKVRRPENSDSH